MRVLREILNWIGRFIAGCIGAALGLVIAVIFSSWFVLKVFEWLAQVTG